MPCSPVRGGWPATSVAARPSSAARWTSTPTRSSPDERVCLAWRLPGGFLRAARHGCCRRGTAGALSRCRAPTTSRRFLRFSSWPDNQQTRGRRWPPRQPTAMRTSSSHGPGCSTCLPRCSVKYGPRQRDSSPAAVARRGNCPGCWSPTCRRCGRGRCAGTCSPRPGRPWSRSKATAGPTAHAGETRDSSTG